MIIDSVQMKGYEGTYLYTKGEQAFETLVYLKNNSLWYEVPKYDFKARMYMVKPDLFRLEGILLAGDSELQFNRDKKGNISGHTYSPCDLTFVPKVK